VSFKAEKGLHEHFPLSDEFYNYCLAVRFLFQTSRAKIEQGGIFGLWDRLDLGGACQDVADILTKTLRANDVPAHLVGGYFVSEGGSSCGHVWTECKVNKDAFIVDATATQFGREWPPVLVASRRAMGNHYQPRNKLKKTDPIEFILTEKQRTRIAARARSLAWDEWCGLRHGATKPSARLGT